MLNDYQRALNSYLRGIPISGPPTPWLHLTTIPIGGLVAIGFAEDEEHLLVISQSGRGVFELPAGARVARDAERTAGWYDHGALIAQGIGPMDGESVTVAGIHGGGLRLLSPDGWSLERVAPDWPNELVFLSPPGSSAFEQRAGNRTFNLGPTEGGEPIVVFGFSRTGRYFVIGSSSAIELFGLEFQAG